MDSYLSTYLGLAALVVLGWVLYFVFIRKIDPR